MNNDISNLTQLSLLDVQKVNLETLGYFDAYCREHNLRYYLLGGSLIGAVRDGALVPWDDDIDVAMPRADYERFCDTFVDTKRYVLISPSRTPESGYGMAKLCDQRTVYIERLADPGVDIGAFVDIFPLDIVKANAVIRMHLDQFLKKMYLFAYMLNKKSSEGKPIKEIVRRFCRLIGRLAPRHRVLMWLEKRFSAEVRKRMVCGSDDLRSDMGGGTYLLANLWGAWGIKECGFPEWFADTITVTIDGAKFCAPCGYDAWLTKVYGDYMTPPENKSYSHGEVYWRGL